MLPDRETTEAKIANIGLLVKVLRLLAIKPVGQAFTT
jgi:hypothetical protein